MASRRVASQSWPRVRSSTFSVLCIAGLAVRSTYSLMADGQASLRQSRLANPAASPAFCDVNLTEHVCPDTEIADGSRICLPPAGWRVSDCKLVVRGRAVFVVENIAHTTSVIRVEDHRRLTLQGDFEFNCEECTRSQRCLRAIKAQYAMVVLNGSFTFQDFCVPPKPHYSLTHVTQTHLSSLDGGTLLAQVLEVTPNSVVSIVNSKNAQGRGGAIAAEHVMADGFMDFANTSTQLDGGAVAIVPTSKRKQRYVFHSWHMECKNRETESKIAGLAMDPRGERLAILGDGCKHLFFSASTGLAEQSHHLNPSAWSTNATSARLLSWSSNGKRLGIGMRKASKNYLYVFEPKPEDAASDFVEAGHNAAIYDVGPGRVRALQFDRDGKFLAYGAGKRCGIIPVSEQVPYNSREFGMPKKVMNGIVTSLAWGRFARTDYLAVAAGGMLSLWQASGEGGEWIDDWFSLATLTDTEGDFQWSASSFKVDRIAWTEETNQLAAWGIRHGQGSHTLRIFNVTEPRVKNGSSSHSFPGLVLDESVEMPYQLVALEWHTSKHHLVYAYNRKVILRTYPLVGGKHFDFSVRDNVTVVRVNATGGHLVVGTDGGHVISLDVSSRIEGSSCKSCLPSRPLGISLRGGANFSSVLAREGSGGAIYTRGGFLWASKVNIWAANSAIRGGAIWSTGGRVHLEDSLLGPDNGCALGKNDAALNWNRALELRNVRLEGAGGGLSLQVSKGIPDEANPCQMSMMQNLSCPLGHMVTIRNWPKIKALAHFPKRACIVYCKSCKPGFIMNPLARACQACPPGLSCRDTKADLRMPERGQHVELERVEDLQCWLPPNKGARELAPVGRFWKITDHGPECWRSLCKYDGYELNGDHCERCDDGFHAERGKTKCEMIPIRFAGAPEANVTKSGQSKVLLRLAVHLSGQASATCTVCRHPKQTNCKTGQAGLDGSSFSVDLGFLRPGWTFKGSCTVFFNNRNKTSDDFTHSIPMTLVALSFYREPETSLLGALGATGLVVAAVCTTGKLKRRPVLASISLAVLVAVCWLALAAVSALPEERGTVMSCVVRVGEALIAFFAVVVCKLRQAEKQKGRVIEDQLNQALSLVREVQHPFVLMRADKLIENGRLLSHEEARNRSLLHIFDTVQAAKGFLRAEADEDDETQGGAFAVFFSHQWTAYDAPDPTGQQFSTISSALRALGTSTQRDLTTVYCWVDYFSIPQANKHIQRLAINSLPIYASLLHAFVIVAPAVKHQNTGCVCDRHTYQRRGWCRAEQLCHCVRRGTGNMYLAGEFGLRRLDGVVPQASSLTERTPPARPRGTVRGRLSQVELKRWFSQALFVFSPHSHFSCCRMSHTLPGGKKMQCDREALMLPMLGLYAEIYRNRFDEDFTELFDEIQKDREAIFPRNFEYITKKRSERRPLFTDLIERLEKKMTAEEKVAQESSAQCETDSLGPMRRLRPLIDVVMFGTRLRSTERESTPTTEVQLAEFSASHSAVASGGVGA